jgi:hypothetical protein
VSGCPAPAKCGAGDTGEKRDQTPRLPTQKRV